MKLRFYGRPFRKRCGLSGPNKPASASPPRRNRETRFSLIFLHLDFRGQLSHLQRVKDETERTLFPSSRPIFGQTVSDCSIRFGESWRRSNPLAQRPRQRQRQRDFSWTAKNLRLFLPLIVENAHVQNINQNVNFFVLLPSINVIVIISSHPQRQRQRPHLHQRAKKSGSIVRSISLPGLNVNNFCWHLCSLVKTSAPSSCFVQPFRDNFHGPALLLGEKSLAQNPRPEPHRQRPPSTSSVNSSSRKCLTSLLLKFGKVDGRPNGTFSSAFFVERNGVKPEADNSSVHP